MAQPKLSRSEWRMAVRSIFSGAYYTGSTHHHILGELRDKVYDPLNERTPAGNRRYSPYDFSYILGYVDAQFELVWENQVEFAYRDKDGVIYSTHRDSQHATTEVFHESGRGNELPDMEACHIWKHNAKPFTDWSVPNRR